MPRPMILSLDVTCDQCGVEFHSSTHRLKTEHKFCSTACVQAYRKVHGYAKPPIKKADPANLLTFACAQCGKDFQRLRYNIKPKYGPFCSHVCYGKWRTENLAGEASPTWKGGYSLDYGRSHWKRQRRLARERDAHKCRDCGTAEQSFGYKLDVHHVVPYDRFDDPEEANLLDNLLTLCRVCHTKRHTAMGAPSTR